MSLHRGFLLCAFPLLSTVLLASGGETPAADGAGSKGPGAAALFSWADHDGDSRLDLAAVTGEGRLQLLVDDGQGRFEDVTERTGLSGVSHAALALWADYDGDGRLDLFVGSSEGPSRLFHNEGGSFVDMTQGSGLFVEGPLQHAAWIDHDEDGRPDLHVVTLDTNELFRGLEGGFFERTELPLPPSSPGVPSLTRLDSAESRAPSPAAGEPSDEDTPTGTRNTGSASAGVRPGDPHEPGNREPLGPSTGAPTLLGFPLACASSIKDQATPGACLEASSAPTLGRLYPLTTNLFVAVGGNVGIGTTTPTDKLDVAGTARVRDTLTLAPPGDVALDLSSGSIYKGGALFIHTKGSTSNTAIGVNAFTNNYLGCCNTASGAQALRNNTFGSHNTASGYLSLFSNTNGSYNTASGAFALVANTNGYWNTASGYAALRDNTTGHRNTASGHGSLRANTTGNYNTASGVNALNSNTTGYHNTASGYRALSYNTTARYNTASGSQALLFNTTGDRNTASGVNALRSNTTGSHNTASGYRALNSNTIGLFNTASGANALASNTTGFFNTAAGNRALDANTTGYRNTACGSAALPHNSTGYDNAAIGYAALYYNTTGSANTAVGDGALAFNSTGSGNIALGRNAGFYATGSNNIDIGNYGIYGESSTTRVGTSGVHTRTFIAGIRGVTTGVANAIPVLVDSNGQLGTVSSSRRFKEEIRDMDDLTDRLLELRPVVFRYRPEVQTAERPLEYGLIAEEVAEVFPELVVYDDDGEPFTVKYHLLASMLLNELEKLRDRYDRELGEHASELAELRGQVAELSELVRHAAAARSPRPSEPARARSAESP
jgi:hypothetical protein